VNLVVNGEVLVTGLDRNLEQILSHIDTAIQQVQRNHEVVEGIFMDDIDISADVPGRLRAHLHEVENIEIRSISQSQFYNNVRNELLHYLPKVIRATESISDLFYGDPVSDAWTLFSKLTDSFSYVAQSIQSMLLYLSYNEPDSALLYSLHAFAEKMETHLKEVDKSIQDQDYVMMADVIKYELGDVLNELLTILEAEAK
jgi:hypothetical protein